MQQGTLSPWLKMSLLNSPLARSKKMEKDKSWLLHINVRPVPISVIYWRSNMCTTTCRNAEILVDTSREFV